MGCHCRRRSLIKRGEIYWVNLDPTVGAEIRKKRPAMIVSNDINNVHAKTVTVLPLTSTVKKIFPFEVFLEKESFGNAAPAKVKADQIRTVDKQRLGQLVGILPEEIVAKIDASMRLHLAL